jgi:hypothetical protein
LASKVVPKASVSTGGYSDLTVTFDPPLADLTGGTQYSLASLEGIVLTRLIRRKYRRRQHCGFAREYQGAIDLADEATLS